MVGWHNQQNRQEYVQTLGDGEGQGSLVSCSPWGCKELDTTEQLNNNKRYFAFFLTVPWITHSGGSQQLHLEDAQGAYRKVHLAKK